MPPQPDFFDEVRIDPAEASDLPRIVELMRALAAVEGRLDTFAATPESLREALFAVHPALECWVARVSGEVRGTALCAFSWSGGAGRPTTRLVNLVVDAPLRRRGVGRRLLAVVAASCVDNGRDLDLMVRDENTAAQRFYAGLGGARRQGWQPWRFSDEALRDAAATAR